MDFGHAWENGIVLRANYDLQNGFKDHGSTNADTFMVKGCMVQWWMQRRPLIELNTVNYSEMIKEKEDPTSGTTKKVAILANCIAIRIA